MWESPSRMVMVCPHTSAVELWWLDERCSQTLLVLLWSKGRIECNGELRQDSQAKRFTFVDQPDTAQLCVEILDQVQLVTILTYCQAWCKKLCLFNQVIKIYSTHTILWWGSYTASSSTADYSVLDIFALNPLLCHGHTCTSPTWTSYHFILFQRPHLSNKSSFALFHPANFFSPQGSWDAHPEYRYQCLTSCSNWGPYALCFLASFGMVK